MLRSGKLLTCDWLPWTTGDTSVVGHVQTIDAESIVPTNLPFENWTEVLGSERLTGAALDRLTHRCHILETTGESYRLQDAQRRRRKKPRE